MKRFFGNFTWEPFRLLRKLLQEIFIWRLRLQAPPIVVLDLDMMVQDNMVRDNRVQDNMVRDNMVQDNMILDNDEAQQRQGVTPTYKKVKGFAPLQMVWGRIIVDAVFRGGHHHSNHKDSTQKMVRHIVGLIRRRYRRDVAIIIRQDAGCFDQKLFALPRTGFRRVGPPCAEGFYLRAASFPGFRPNTAYFYTTLIAFLIALALFDSFKQDISDPVVAVTAYATTFRRLLADARRGSARRRHGPVRYRNSLR